MTAVGNSFNTISGIKKLDGSTGEIKHSAGQVLLIDFWATWCPPCQRPMAHNQEMVTKNADKWSSVRIIGLSIDDDVATVRSHVTAKGWTSVEHYQDNGGHASDAWGVTGVPHCVLIGKDGKITWRGHPASVDLEVQINALLAK